MSVGSVKFYNADKGYGFLTPEGGPDIFFHVSALDAADMEDPRIGDRIEYEMGVSPKNGKSLAVNLRYAKMENPNGS